MRRIDLLPAEEPGLERRERQRRAIRAEILEISLEVMREEGVAGLSLAEVARRMGVKPPSLYKHVDSKHAVYDALFAAGMRAHRSAVEAALEGLEQNLAALEAGFEASVRWCVEHPTLAQLMYWRPVPNFEPSPESYATALEMNERIREFLAGVVDRGELQPDACSEEGLAIFACLASGVITQQLANEPDVPFEVGRFSRHTRQALGLFIARYGKKQPAGHPSRT